MKTKVLLVLVVLAGCDGKEKRVAAEKAEEAKIETRAQELAGKMASDIEAKRLADDAKRKAEDLKAYRDRLDKQPQDFFEASGLKLLDKGKNGQLHSVQQLSLTNKSRFAATQVAVRMDFTKDGVVVASIPLELKGLLPANGTRLYSVDDGTLESAAVQTPSNDTHLTIVSAVIDPGALPSD